MDYKVSLANWFPSSPASKRRPNIEKKVKWFNLKNKVLFFIDKNST